MNPQVEAEAREVAAKNADEVLRALPDAMQMAKAVNDGTERIVALLRKLAASQVPKDVGEWTHEPPTEDGWYWIRKRLKGPNLDLGWDKPHITEFLVELSRGPLDLYQFWSEPIRKPVQASLAEEEKL